MTRILALTERRRERQERGGGGDSLIKELCHICVNVRQMRGGGSGGCK
jgi:hypothetical protein